VIEPGRRSAGYREHPPRPELRSFVACYWTHTWSPGRTHRVLPDGAIDLVFDLARPEGSSAFAVGTMTRPLVVLASSQGDFLGVRFRPGRAAALLRLDAHELTDRRVAFAELWGSPGMRLLEELGTARGTPARLQILERELLRRLTAAGETDPYVDAVVEEAIRRRGAIDVREMERLTGVSGVWLRRGFRRHVGTGPKFFCRVMRLQAVVARIRCERDPHWATLALDHAFSDQAHLTREFSALAGVAPTRFLAETSRRFRFLQEVPPASP
jgi:AraC-like DNA-binding protein